MGDIGDKLKAATGGARLSDFDGQNLTVISIEKGPSPFKVGETSVKANAVTEEGEEVSLYVTPNAGKQLMAVEDDLPLELAVYSFPGQFGKTGYGFAEVVKE